MLSRQEYLRHARACALAAIVILGALIACADDGARKPEVAEQPPHRLDGSWDLSMRLERPMSLSATPSALPFSVRGTVTLTTNARSDISFESLVRPTQIGVYALRLDSLGLLPWERGDVPTVAARESRPRAGSAASRDSVQVVLNPALRGRIVRLEGVIGGGAVRGNWRAESPLGGGGTFEMRRSATPWPGTP